MSDAALAKDDTKSVRIERKSRQESDDGALSPEEALKIAQETIKAQTKTIETSRTAVAAANTEVANVTVARLNDRKNQIAASITTAEMALASANTTFRAARESGDIDAEAKALDLLADAKLEHKTWSAEKVKLEALEPQILAEAKKKTEAPQGNAEYDAAANQWIAEHPLMNKDQDYTDAALDAHAAALARNYAPGSPQYLSHINGTLTRIYGKNHGRPDDSAGEKRNDGGSSTAAAPGRESTGGFSSHGLRLVTNADGKHSISGNIPADWRESAKICKMTEVDYCVEQLLIAKQRQEDNSGVQEYAGGVIYR